MLLEARANRAHERAGEIGHALSIDGADRTQHSDREPSEQRAGSGFELSPGATDAQRDHARAPRTRQKLTTIFPKTCRLSSRASPRSNSASVTSAAITCKSPLAILA